MNERKRPGVVSDQVPPSQPRPQIESSKREPRQCANCGRCPTCGK